MSVVAFKPERRPIPIPPDACRIYSDSIARTVDPFGKLVFSLRRARGRRGVDVCLTVLGAPNSDASALQWSLSRQHDLWPASFAEARSWVAEYLARYGQSAQEAKKP